MEIGLTHGGNGREHDTCSLSLGMGSILHLEGGLGLSLFWSSSWVLVVFKGFRNFNLNVQVFKTLVLLNISHTLEMKESKNHCRIRRGALA